MKKIIIAVLLIAAMLLSLAACGGTEKETVTTTAPATENTTATLLPPPEPTGDDDDDDDDEDIINLYLIHGSAVIDGVKDAAWDKAQVANLELLKTGNQPKSEISVLGMWDEEAFYFYAEIKDEDLSFTSTQGDWKNDSLYLYVCEDFENHLLIGSDGDFASYNTYQFALINATLEMLPRKGDSAVSAQCQTAYLETDDGFAVEFKYTPLGDSKAATLKAGNMVLVDYQYNDCSNGDRVGALGFCNGSDDNFKPYLWAYTLLLEEGAEPPTHVAVIE